MEPSCETKASLSFVFKKKQETVHLKKSIVQENEEKEDNTKDFVLSLEGKELRSTKEDRGNKKKSEYVIPLIHQNKWRTENGLKESNNLDLLAAEEVLKDSAKLNDEWEQKGSNEETTRSIPLLMHNKVPDGFETESKLDVALRPSAPNDADYDQIPIEHFGMAMLRGMGWNESRGVGKNGQVIAPVEAQIRPKGLGLGADRSTDKSKTTKVLEGKDESDSFEIKKGSFCVVTAGSNKDLYGLIEGVDEDNCRVMIKLALSGKTCNLMQCNISLVSKKEYDKFSKYLNKQKSDKYKKDEEEKLLRQNKITKDSNKLNGNHKESYSRKRQYADEDNYYSNSNDNGHRVNPDNSEDNEHSGHHKKHSRHKKSKHKKSHKIDKYEKVKTYSITKTFKSSNSSASDHDDDKHIAWNEQRPWVQQDLRVRVVDKSFKKFYKEKVIIVDVPTPGVCVCKSNDGKVLDGISQSSLETVIPRDDNSFVLIVTGTQRGQIGQIMKRDKDKCLTLVQLLSDRDIVLKLGYDEVCEYVGNVHVRDDY